MTHSHPRSMHGEEFSSERPEALVDRLTAEGAKRIYVDGSSIIRDFLSAHLLTDVTLSVVPVLLGDGVRLFGETGGDVRLELVESRSFRSGLVQLAYRVRPS